MSIENYNEIEELNLADTAIEDEDDENYVSPEYTKLLEDISLLPLNDIGNVVGISCDLIQRMIEWELICEDDLVGGDGRADVFDLMYFMKDYPAVEAYGYLEFKDGVCSHVCLEGLEYSGQVSRKMAKDFIEQFRHADDFILEDDYLACWYD